MARVLVTGASGFIGRQVCELLVERGHQVVGTYHSSSPRSEIGYPEIDWIQADLQSEKEARELIEAVRPDNLVHMAWLVAPGNYDDPANEGWLNAGKVLVDAFYEAGGRKFVGAGSCFEYDWSDGLCSEERTPLNSLNLYGRCKTRLAEYLEDRAEHHGREWAWGRIFFVYGPYENEGRFVSSVVLSLLEGQNANCSHGRQIRDYLHSKDVAGGLVALMEPGFSGACNIGSGDEVSLRQLGAALMKAVPNDAMIDFGAIPARENEPPVILADTKRLFDEVGWMPSFTLESGTKDVVDFWANQRAVSFSKSLNQ